MFLVRIFDSDVFNPNTNIEVIFFVLGGLGIFLFGLSLMSDSLRNIAGHRLKSYIEKATKTPLRAIITGLVITAIIQSSSGTTVIVIGLVTAGLMSLPQAIGVIVGSNIGTTVTAFLVGLKISELALPAIGLGAIMVFFINRRNFELVGLILVGLGMLFLGLDLMGAGFDVVITKSWFVNLMRSLESNVFFSVLTGTAITALVQSSSAVIGVLQELYETGEVPIRAALGILLGSNIGTTVTIIIASLGGNRESQQAAASHLFFNVFGTIVFLLFFNVYAGIISNIEDTLLEPSSKMTIAIAHIGFNVITTLILFFFIDKIVWFINKIIPIKQVPTSLSKLNDDLLESPILALKAAKECILEMGAIAREMVVLAKKYLNEGNEEYFNRCNQLEDVVDDYDHQIHDYLVQIETKSLDKEIGMTQAIYIDAIRDFERIGDHSVNLVEFFKSRYQANVNSTDILVENLNDFFDIVLDQLNNAIESFTHSDISKAKLILENEENIDTLERKYRNIQLSMIGDGTLSLNDIHYVDILSNLERIADHCVNIAQNVIDPHYINRT